MILPSRVEVSIFQSTLSMRRATGITNFPTFMAVFQSTLSMRRATQADKPLDQHTGISIHALHEESDELVVSNISSQQFQSTLSMRRATSDFLSSDFN